MSTKDISIHNIITKINPDMDACYGCKLHFSKMRLYRVMKYLTTVKGHMVSKTTTFINLCEECKNKPEWANSKIETYLS